jgi:hypothetical protein
MAERCWKIMQGWRIAFQFWWLNRSVEHLRKTMLKRANKKSARPLD